MARCRLPSMVLLAALIAAPLSSAQDATLPPLTPFPPAATNLLENSSFEASETGAWQFTDWPPREETGARLIADSVRFSTEQAYDGERCLVIDLTTVGADRTLIAQQKVSAQTLAPHDGEPMRMSARVLLGAGPTAQEVRMTLRQWGEDGLLSSQTVRLTADVNEWSEGSTEFTLRTGETTRADVNVTVAQSPDLSNSPIVYVDDVRLEVLAEPALDASLPWGDALMAPEESLPVAVRISQEAWEAGRRGLRWDITTSDGSRSLAHAELSAETPRLMLSVAVADLDEGTYALRLALGTDPGERWREVLLPFVRAEGPLAR